MGHSTANLRAYARVNGPTLAALEDPLTRPISRPIAMGLAVGNLKDALFWLEHTMDYVRENPAAVRNRLRLLEEAMKRVLDEANRP